jgi:hypothetical protein
MDNNPQRYHPYGWAAAPRGLPSRERAAPAGVEVNVRALVRLRGDEGDAENPNAQIASRGGLRSTRRIDRSAP